MLRVVIHEEVAVLKREVACKDYEINVLKSEFEKVKQEKEGIEFKIEKFDKASKDLDKLLGSQITDKSKKGLGYSAVPPPHPLIYNRPKKLDLSYSGLDEFKEPEFKAYGSEVKQVSKDTSSFVESSLNVDKETVFPVDKKVEFVKPKNHEKPVKKSVRYAEMYRSQTPRGNQRNWNGQKSNQLGRDFVMYNKACFICGSFDHVQINCNHHQRKRIVSRNNYNRVDYDYYAKTTHPSVHRNMTPRAVLLKTGLTPLNIVRPVNTAHPKPAVHRKEATNKMIHDLLTVDAQATLDESMLWHRRLGHINFKNINKLVKDNLVRGLPIKHFENDQTCVACLLQRGSITKILNWGLIVKPHNKTPYELFRVAADLVDNGEPKSALMIKSSPDVTTGSFKLNVVGLSVNTASLYDQDSPKDMFTMGASHTLEATHVEFFSDEDEPEVDLGNIRIQVQNRKEDGIFISQDKYVAEILKKFNYTDVKSASTLVDWKILYVKDGRCMMMLMQTTLGLWYSRDSPFELVAYTVVDYVAQTQDRKSTTGGC
ncbi:putative ribonuclease H-like domain-containing protein [Tanacetum coccineum]